MAGSGEDQRSRLQADPAWAASRFADLETFIFDFLSGSAGGEGVRLKLQTPLSISEALLAAATQQLRDELDVAQQVPSAAVLERMQQAWHCDAPHLARC